MFEPKVIEKQDFVQVVPEDGLQAAHVGMLVYLGKHKQMPRYAKDQQGNIELNDDGSKKIIHPKEGEKGLVQKIGVYADLLSQTHDYGEEIGVRNIREPMHQSSYGISEGVNYTTIAPRDAQKNYIKGRPWTLAPTSLWAKIAAVTKTEQGQLVKDVIFAADYNNPNLNNVGVLLGRPFMVNVEVKSTEKDGKTYHNVRLKNPVPLMKGMQPSPSLISPVSISFKDNDLLEKKEELGGACKFDLIRKADLHKIVLAEDYPGSKMQKAVQEKLTEEDVVSKAKELYAKKMAGDKELQEILSSMGSEQKETPVPPKPQPSSNTGFDPGDMDEDIPF